MPDGSTTLETSHFGHLESLVSGFENLLSLLAFDSDQRKELIGRFQAATCNRVRAPNFAPPPFAFEAADDSVYKRP
jgi:hypothetical protein